MLFYETEGRESRGIGTRLREGRLESGKRGKMGFRYLKGRDGMAARHEHGQVAGNKVEITKEKHHYYGIISQISNKAKVKTNIISI